MRSFRNFFWRQPRQYVIPDLKEFFDEGRPGEGDGALKFIQGKLKSKHVYKITSSSNEHNYNTLWPVGHINSPSFKFDLADILISARAVTPRKFNIYRADDGRAEPCTYKPLNNAKPVAICFSVPAAIYDMYFGHIAWQVVEKRDPGFDFLKEQTSRICFRFLADRTLLNGELELALTCLRAARDGDYYNTPLKARPLATPGLALAWEAAQKPLSYMPRTYFAFAHELGHSADPDLIQPIWTYEKVSLGRLEAECVNTADNFEKGAKDAHAPDPERIIEEIGTRIRRDASKWADNLRKELLADLSAVKILWDTCKNRHYAHSKQPDVVVFCVEFILALVFLMVRQSLIEVSEVNHQQERAERVERLLRLQKLSQYSTGVRVSTIIDAFLENSEIFGIQKISGPIKNKLRKEVESVAAIGKTMMQAGLAAASRLDTLRAFDEGKMKYYLQRPEHTSMLDPDIQNFWNLVDETQLWNSAPALREHLYAIKDERIELRRAAQERLGR